MPTARGPDTASGRAGGAAQARQVTSAQVARLLALRDAHHTCGGPDRCDPPWCMMCCDRIAPQVQAEFGWPVVVGFYSGPEVAALDLVDGALFVHVWNVLDDGTIVDASNNQFGEEGRIRVIPPRDARARWYWADRRARAILPPAEHGF